MWFEAIHLWAVEGTIPEKTKKGDLHEGGETGVIGEHSFFVKKNDVILMDFLFNLGWQ